MGTPTKAISNALVVRPKRAQFTGLEAVVKVVSMPDPVLRQSCEAIDLAEIETQLALLLPLGAPRSLDALVGEMLSTMQASNGAGLAAPQIGIPLRLVVMDPGRTGAPFIMVNPIRNGISQAMKWDIESCLSCGTDKYRVRRRKVVSIEWIDTRGGYRTKTFRGWAARVVQHELDHLDGDLISDVGRKVKR